MALIFGIRNGFVLLGLGAALVVLIGCNTDVSTSKTAPGGASARRQFEKIEKDVEKDLKPPVIIKPNVSPATGAEQAEPKQNSP